MKRVAKHEGFGNIVLDEAPVPQPGARQVLVRVHRTLISRGSEIYMRYVSEEAKDHSIMGYSAAGEVAGLGEAVTEYAVGQRVVAVAPHAQYVLTDLDTDILRLHEIPDALSLEHATFVPLLTSSILWAEVAQVQEGDAVVVLGQGLVGSLVMQLCRRYAPAFVVGVDATELRCRIARELGADTVINCVEEDSVEAVRQLTDGRGADVVIEAVGGYAGVRSFEQAQDMLRSGGHLVLLSLYQAQPLPLHASKIMSSRLTGGNFGSNLERRRRAMAEAIELIASEQVRVAPMITHCFPLERSPEAFHLLYNSPDQALGVVLEWA